MIDLTWALMATGAAVVDARHDQHVTGGGFLLTPVDAELGQPAGVIVAQAFSERFAATFDQPVADRVADAFNDGLTGVLTSLGFAVARTPGRGQPLVVGRV